MDSISGQIRLDSPAGSTAENCSVTAPIVCRLDNIVLALRGNLRLIDRRIATEADAHCVIEAFKASGKGMLADLRGHFALMAWQPTENRALIAVDRMGIERLAWGHENGILALGTSAGDVARRLFATRELDPQALFGFMLSHMIPAPMTVFRGVRKLPPATAVEFQGGNVTEFRYWTPNFDRPSSIDLAGLRESVLPALSRAIELNMPDAETGSFLSGGLDSSTVTGLLAQVNSESANAFSMGFGVAEFDEMEFADSASQHFGCRHYKYEVTADDIVAAIPKIAATYDEPFGNSSAVPTYYCARLAKEHGISHLLAGDGGDEIFGGNERYVRHRVFEIYSKIPAAVRGSIIEPIASRLDPETSPFPLRKFSSYVRQARIPLPERFESWNLIYREGPEKVFGREFLANVDTQAPLHSMTEVWQACPSDDLLDRMLWYDWKFTLADNDIRKVSTMSELAGVRVSYPMLEEEFVDLSIRIPSGEKISGHELRTFFKSAVRDFLPDKIISKQKHGFGLPFGQWLKTHEALQSLVYGSLESLRARGVFDERFLERVAAEHRGGHASYYGYAIWDLVMLEQWFQHHSEP